MGRFATRGILQRPVHYGVRIIPYTLSWQDSHNTGYFTSLVALGWHWEDLSIPPLHTHQAEQSFCPSRQLIMHGPQRHMGLRRAL